MFYAKQFKSILDAVKQLDPDAEVVPSLLRITFTLPNVGKCVLQYDHQGFDEAYNAVGTVKLSYGDRTTEFDSLQNTLDGVEGLSRMTADEAKPAEDKFVLIDNFPEWAIEPMVNDTWGDYLAYCGEGTAKEDFTDIDRYMTSHGFCGIHAPSDEEYNQGHNEFCSHPAFGKACATGPVYAVKGQWKPLMKEFNLASDEPVTESVDDQPKEMTEDGVKKVIGALGLDISNIWYDGNKNRPVFDCKAPDGKTICVWNEPPYEAKVWVKDSDPRDNGLAEDIVSLDELKTKLSSLAGVQPTENADESAMYTFEDSSDGPNDFIIELESKKGWTPDTANILADFVNRVFNRDGKIEVFYMGSFSDDEGGSIFQIYVDQSNMTAPVQRDAFRMTIQHGIDAIFGNENDDDDDDAERAVGDAIDTAMMDHYDSMNGDIGDIDFEAALRGVCDEAGQHALAEAIGELYKACHPMVEAAEKVHTVPEEMARAVNDYIADTYYTHPETREQLRASELEGNWDWLDEEADELIPIWNETHSGEKVWQARCDIEERGMPL